MKRLFWPFLALAIALPPRIAHAQVDPSVLDVLKQQMQQLKQQMQQIQQQMQLLQQKIEQLEAVKPAAPPAETVTQEQMKQLNERVDRVVEAQKKTLPGEFNPAIGLVGETIFSRRSGSSTATGSDRPGGFDVFQRSVELNLSASVDPFAKGYAVINAQADPVSRERRRLRLRRPRCRRRHCPGIWR